MKNIIAISIIGLFLTACSANPTVVKVKQSMDNGLNCYNLENEIRKAQYLKKESRKEDRFRMRYMMPTTAIMSIYNINKAESRAIKRIKHLQSLQQQKRCYNRRLTYAY